MTLFTQGLKTNCRDNTTFCTKAEWLKSCTKINSKCHKTTSAAVFQLYIYIDVIKKHSVSQYNDTT